VSLAEKLERLSRLVPGAADYQDRERSRDADRAIRLRLAAELEGLGREIERDKRTLVEAKDLVPLPGLDRLSGQLEKLGRAATYAARGYRAVFDPVKADLSAIERLCTFDLGLFDELGALRARAAALREALQDHPRLATAVADMDEALDRFEAAFSRRETVFGDA
jgi:hypothetical protein